MTPAQISLAWLLAQKPWVVPIPSTTKLHRLKENIQAAAVELTRDELREIEDSLAQVRSQGDRYPRRSPHSRAAEIERAASRWRMLARWSSTTFCQRAFQPYGVRSRTSVDEIRRSTSAGTCAGRRRLFRPRVQVPASLMVLRCITSLSQRVSNPDHGPPRAVGGLVEVHRVRDPLRQGHPVEDLTEDQRPGERFRLHRRGPRHFSEPRRAVALMKL